MGLPPVGAIAPPPPPAQHPPAPALAGWGADLRLGLAPRGGRTVLAHKTQRGPLAVQRGFHPEGAPCHLYLLHPPGGIVGGDRLAIGVEVAAGAHGLITMPGATKCYRSAGPTATLTQRLDVAAGGVLEWLPQETILFPGACIHTRTLIALQGDARFLGWEVACLGRPAIAEPFDRGEATFGLRVTRDGQPLLDERLVIADARAPGALSGLRGLPVTATLLASGADAADLAAARDALPPPDAALPWGITLLGDLLVARALGRGVEPVQRLWRRLWGMLRPRLLGLPACPPRIWAT